MCNCDRNVRIKDEVQNTLLQYNCSNVFYISYFTEAYKDILTMQKYGLSSDIDLDIYCQYHHLECPPSTGF